MARTFIYTCDCCGHEVRTGSATLPQYWADITIIAATFYNWTGGGGPQVEKHALVCSSCQVELAALLRNPKAWVAKA